MQQPVVQDLNLPLVAVTGLDLDGVIRRVQGRARGGVQAAPVPQVQDVGLNQTQQGVGRRVPKIVEGIPAHLDQLILEGLARLSPGGEQGITLVQQRRAVRRAARQGALPDAGLARLVHEIGPILPTRIEHEEIDRN